LGTHRIHAELPGRVAVDTTIVVTLETKRVVLGLREEPPGELIVLGDVYALQIRIDGERVATGTQHYRAASLRPGKHQIFVQLPDGRSLEAAVDVPPGHRIVFDYSRNQVTRKESLKGQDK
jgi:hypothetical protein